MQDRELDHLGLYEVAVKWLRVRVGNPYIDTLAHTDAQIDTGTQADTETINTIHHIRTDSFVFVALDPVSYTACQHVAEFL